MIYKLCCAIIMMGSLLAGFTVYAQPIIFSASEQRFISVVQTQHIICQSTACADLSKQQKETLSLSLNHGYSFARWAVKIIDMYPNICSNSVGWVFQIPHSFIYLRTYKNYCFRGSESITQHKLKVWQEHYHIGDTIYLQGTFYKSRGFYIQQHWDVSKHRGYFYLQSITVHAMH